MLYLYLNIFMLMVFCAVVSTGMQHVPAMRTSFEVRRQITSKFMD